MKFSKDVLLEVMSAFQKGLSEGIDISDILRKIDVDQGEDGMLKLSDDYLKTSNRKTE